MSNDKMREALISIQEMAETFHCELGENWSDIKRICEAALQSQQPESEPTAEVDHDDCTLCGGCGEIETDNIKNERATVSCPECIYREIEAGMYARPQPTPQVPEETAARELLAWWADQLANAPESELPNVIRNGYTRIVNLASVAAPSIAEKENTNE